MKFSSITRLVTSLLDKTDEQVIMTRLAETFEGINKHTVPMLAIPDTIGKDSALMRAIENTFTSRRLPVLGYRKNPVAFIRKTFVTLAEHENDYKKLFEESFKRGALKEALTYKQVQLLQLLKAIDFASDFTRRLTITLANLEMNTFEKPVDKEYLEYVTKTENLKSYAIVLSALNHKFSDTMQMLDKLKDLSYSVEQEELMSKMRGKAVDPLQMGLIPVVGDLVVFFGEIKNMYSKYRYDRAQDEKQKLELTILLLERSKEGADEEELAAIQRQIDYYSNRIIKLGAQIESVEEEAK